MIYAEHSLGFPDSLNLASPQFGNLLSVELLPCIKFDKANSLQDLSGEAHAFIGDFHTLLSLSKHNFYEDKL